MRILMPIFVLILPIFVSAMDVTDLKKGDHIVFTENWKAKDLLSTEYVTADTMGDTAIKTFRIVMGGKSSPGVLADINISTGEEGIVKKKNVDLIVGGGIAVIRYMVEIQVGKKFILLIGDHVDAIRRSNDPEGDKKKIDAALLSVATFPMIERIDINNDSKE